VKSRRSTVEDSAIAYVKACHEIVGSKVRPRSDEAVVEDRVDFLHVRGNRHPHLPLSAQHRDQLRAALNEDARTLPSASCAPPSPSVCCISLFYGADAHAGSSTSPVISNARMSDAPGSPCDDAGGKDTSEAAANGENPKREVAANLQRQNYPEQERRQGAEHLNPRSWV
jgi:hypothetical protein